MSLVGDIIDIAKLLRDRTKELREDFQEVKDKGARIVNAISSSIEQAKKRKQANDEEANKEQTKTKGKKDRRRSPKGFN